MESQDKDLNTELNNDLKAESPPDVAPVEPQAEEPGYAVPPSPKKSKAPLIIAIVAAAALLCVVCVVGVVGVVLARQYLPFLAPKRAAARLMPADTAFFTSDTDSFAASLPFCLASWIKCSRTCWNASGERESVSSHLSLRPAQSRP